MAGFPVGLTAPAGLDKAQHSTCPGMLGCEWAHRHSRTGVGKGKRG